MKHADDNPRLQQLIAQLQSPDVLARYAAALDLGELGDPRAVEPLIAALEDAEGYVACAAAIALGQIGDSRAVTPLVALLAATPEGGDYRLAYPVLDESGAVTGTLMTGGVFAEVLGKLGEPGFQALLTILHDYADHEFIGEPVAFRLGELGDRRAIPALIQAFHSDVYEVRSAGAEALASFGEDALPVLLDLLHAGLAEWDSSLEPLTHALRRIGEPAVEPLIELLCTSDDQDVRLVAVEALGSIGAYTEELEDSLRGEVRNALRSALGDMDKDVRLEAALKLGDMHDASGLDILLTALDADREQTVRNAQYAFRDIGTKAIWRLLETLADAKQTIRVRVRAVETLEFIGDARAIPGLIAALQDADRQVRVAAEGALGHLNAQEALEPLREVLASAAAEADADERLTTLIALAKVGDTSVTSALLDMAISASVSDSPHTPGTLSVPIRVMFALASLNESGLEALRALLEQGNMRPGYEIVWGMVMRSIGEPALPLLRAAARDPRPRIRSQALSELNQWWDDTLAEQRLSDLHNADPGLRRAAASALERHAQALPTAASEPLIAALDDVDLWVRYHAARTLGVIGDERAIQPLLRCRANTTGTLPASNVKSDCMTAVIAIFHRSREIKRQADTK